MPTWQSKRHSNRQRGRRQLSPEALAAKRQRADDARMALPCPPRPVEHQPGTLLLELELREPGGQSLGVLTLHAPSALPRGRRTRVDSYEVRSPWGAVLVQRGGLHAACRAAVATVWPRQVSRRAVATMATDPQPEADDEALHLAPEPPHG